MLLNNFVSSYPGKLSSTFSFTVRATPAVAQDFAVLSEDISSYLRGKYSVLLLCENEVEAAAMTTMLNENDIAAVHAPTLQFEEIKNAVTVSHFGIKGFEMQAEKFVCISLAGGGFVDPYLS